MRGQDGQPGRQTLHAPPAAADRINLQHTPKRTHESTSKSTRTGLPAEVHRLVQLLNAVQVLHAGVAEALHVGTVPGAKVAAGEGEEVVQLDAGARVPRVLGPVVEVLCFRGVDGLVRG